LGQRWGVRRFQNPDGTYTAEGKKRRNLDDWFEPKIKSGKDKPPISKAEKVSKESEKAFGGIEKLVSFTEKRINADEINKRNKEIEKMTDDDLRKKTNRLNLETNYIDAINKRETANGKIAATDIINAVGGSLAIIGGVVGIATAIKTK
jgi:hypothetical protein